MLNWARDGGRKQLMTTDSGRNDEKESIFQSNQFVLIVTEIKIKVVRSLKVTRTSGVVA